MRSSRLKRALAGALLVAGAATVTAAAPAAQASSGSGNGYGVQHIAVSFVVRNVNRSKVACAADGATYRVRGDLVVPRSSWRTGGGGRAVTLYLHGLSFGEYFWNFTDRGGYAYADKLALAGQTSLIVDRLGYGTSDKPGGFGICAGSRADVAHQIVQQLRSGRYQHQDQAGRFGRVYLAGHSFGGQIAQIEAYSFRDIDGLVVVSYSDVGQTALLKSNAAYAARVCAAGGKRTPGGPGGYAPFGDPAKAPAALFRDVDPRVLAAARPKLSIDPCGDSASLARATATDLRHVRDIRVSVLLVQGGADALFDANALPRQARLFSRSSTVDTAVVPGTAHAITLERTRNQFALTMIRALYRFQR